MKTISRRILEKLTSEDNYEDNLQARRTSEDHKLQDNEKIILSRGGLEGGSLLYCHTTSADVLLGLRSFRWEIAEER